LKRQARKPTDTSIHPPSFTEAIQALAKVKRAESGDPTRAEDLLRMLAQTARESEKTFIASIHPVEPARQM